MKALDTPVLLDILRGAPSARTLIGRLGPEELATTELNLWELGVLAHQDRSRGVERRLAALERLRQKLTVLPFDAASTAHALHRLGQARNVTNLGSSSRAMILGILEAHGCSEWVTTRSELGGIGASSVKGVEYPTRESKKRK